jgi:hypothetical protein
VRSGPEDVPHAVTAVERVATTGVLQVGWQAEACRLFELGWRTTTACCTACPCGVVVVEPAGQLRLEQAGSSVARLRVRRVVGMMEPFVRTAEDRLPDHALVIADVAIDAPVALAPAPELMLRRG